MSRSWGGRWRVALVAAATAGSVVGLTGASGAAGTSAPTTTRPVAATTTTSAPLTLAEWKAQYEPAIGQIADDALVVYDTGRRNAKLGTKKSVKATITLCQKWHHDATTVPQEVPAIPSAAAEGNWRGMVSASISASSNCLTALQRGSKPATKRFLTQLALVDDRERLLVKELGGTAAQ